MAFSSKKCANKKSKVIILNDAVPESIERATKLRKLEKMERSDYKSSLHYIALRPSHTGLSFEDFLLHFSNNDIGILDLAISETILRNAFHKRLGSFYNNNVITCMGELAMIENRNVCIEKCIGPKLSIGTVNSFVMFSYFELIYPFVYRQRGV